MQTPNVIRSFLFIIGGFVRKLEKRHVGKKFGKLTIIDQIPGRKCLCLCDCGEKKILKTGNVTLGITKSCGCLRSIYREDYDEDMKEKLLNSVDIMPNGCWIWNKALHRQGYGHFPYKRKLMLAHRLSWILFKGKISEEILVCHNCPGGDNPSCCNPDHLFLGTDRDNSIDAFKKGLIIRKKGSAHYFSKLTEKDIKKIRELKKLNFTHQSIGEKFGIAKSTVTGILNGRSWKHV